jgi:hypothetical protein
MPSIRPVHSNILLLLRRQRDQQGRFSVLPDCADRAMYEIGSWSACIFIPLVLSAMAQQVRASEVRS